MTARIDLLDAVPYLRAYAGQIFVVKVGGELLQHVNHRDSVARDLAVLHRLGIRTVLVHGGGPQLDAALQRRGVETERVAGRRITCKVAIEEAIREWRGQCSSQWVSALHSQGESAVGLSGTDGGLLQATRRPSVVTTTDSGERVTVDYGYVGDIGEVRADLLRAVLDTGSIPFLSPLARGRQGETLNVNADTVAAEVAVAIGAAKLILLTSAPGILRDLSDPTSVLHWTDLGELAELELKGALSGGMRPKVAAIRVALKGGVPRVHVVDGRVSGTLLDEVFTTEGAGTLVVPRREAAS